MIALVADMNARGYGVAESCISSETLTDLRRIISDSVAKAGGEYIAFSASQMEGTYLQELARSANFQDICRQVYQTGMNRSAPPIVFYNILRCLAGRTGEQNAYVFHYDSYVLTVLVPILIPTEGQPGDLLMFPNTRPVRKSYIVNLIDKLWLDNHFMQTYLRKGIQSGRLTPTRVHMRPGNVYFFWGCRSVHANEPCDPDKIRATALYHYVDPHAESWLRKVLLALRHRKPRLPSPAGAIQPA